MMNRTAYFLIGAAAGAALAAALHYFLGPAPGTTYDANYRSRLDFALEEGRRAAAAREQELRQQLADLRKRSG
ncbi:MULTISPECIES: hypothetical protein [Caldilinea]|jgi:hypothetical protein|uniref:YtxH domain-containing protein n=1 Tax=Caldilinea aerophila (strain DSM 14535 / JCM 11387 / NBRC 104270 / STL-6-O1) TaxID=926550 RepID=I0HYH3_CALAS|nr:MULTISPECIES: hypothetical protein [Caldilinea]MBO9391301.1 hypothetical protein [Caldilinea sp.]BAL98060.1 hypothetical protein CLDAP_00210 [Caldilinea aerophila DSM 14535 = NBRC 104270]